MAKNLTQSNINFTVNTTETIGGFGHKRTNSNLISGGKYDVSLKQQLIDGNHESDWGGFSVNAVDIDWNGAEFPNTTPLAPSTINTTGDLINAIKWASAQGTTYNNATTSSAGLMSSGDKIKLDNIDSNANNYTLQVATDGSLGGIKLGYTETGKKYAVKLSNDAAYVEVPWTDTTINANIDTPNKKLTVSDDNGQKFQIKLSLVPIDLSNQNSEKIAALEITAGGNTINTILPGIKIDEQNRKMYWIGADGQQSSEFLQFGNLDIIDVFEDSVISLSGSRYYANGENDLTSSSSNIIKYPVYIGDLFILKLSVSGNNEYHLFVCNEVILDLGYLEVTTNGAIFNAYFTDLGVFPGNNITLNAYNIRVTGINSEATGGNNISNVQEALNNTLYYEVIDSVEEEDEEEDGDNTTTQDQGD